MSLINRMLLDLDARADEVEELELRPRPIVEDLRPANDSRLQASLARPRHASVAILSIVFVALGYVLVSRYDRASTSTESPPTQIAPVSAPTRTEPVAPATEPVGTPRVESVAQTPALLGQSTDPAVTESGEAPTTEKSVSSIAPKHPEAVPTQARSVETTTATTNVPTETLGFSRVARELTPEQVADRNFQLGTALRRGGDIAEAEHALRKALELNPRHNAAREMLTDLYIEQGHWQDAQQLLYQGIAVDPDYFEFSMWLARIHVDLGDEPRAITLLESGLPRATRSADYRALLAALYQRAGRHAEAVIQYREAVTLQPRNGPWWLGLGISCEAEKDWTGARDAYLRAIGTNALNTRLASFADQRLRQLSQIHRAEAPDPVTD